MRKIWRMIQKGELGQAFPITLALLIIGGLTILPSLGLTYSSAKTSNMLQEGTKGTYAADAGIEDTLWALAHGAEGSMTRLLAASVWGCTHLVPSLLLLAKPPSGLGNTDTSGCRATQRTVCL